MPLGMRHALYALSRHSESQALEYKNCFDNVMEVEEWKMDDDPSEYNFLICDILNLQKDLYWQKWIHNTLP